MTPDFAHVTTYTVEARECSGVSCFAVGMRSIGFTARPPSPSPALRRCLQARFDVLETVPPAHGMWVECRHAMKPEGFASPMLKRLERAPDDACASGQTRCWVKPPEVSSTSR